VNGILQRIFEARRASVADAESRVSLETLREESGRRDEVRDFAGALRRPPYGIVAEIKRMSPSRGVLRDDFDPTQLADAYRRGRATAISVVTEPDFFGGSLSWLAEVRRLATCPILRKDFIFSEYQVWESRAAGADAILLILAMLDDPTARTLQDAACRAGLQVLVEIHDVAEAERATALGAEIVGVNNRDLTTFDVSLETSRRLAPRLSDAAVRVSESGIFTAADCAQLSDCGFHAFLIGEALVVAPDPAERLAAMWETRAAR
jgi:indole-3-glycerol phosphate synthase